MDELSGEGVMEFIKGLARFVISFIGGFTVIYLIGKILTLFL